MFQTLTLAYDKYEDRIMAVTDIDTSASWSCWLTRRVALAFLTGASAYLERTSPLAAKAPAHHRDDLVEFERDMALDRTATATTRSGGASIIRHRAKGELAVSVSLLAQGAGFRLELHGNRGGKAFGDLSRSMAQRIVKALTDECVRGEWACAANLGSTGTIASGSSATRH
jgi:hypothetical protein